MYTSFESSGGEEVGLGLNNACDRKHYKILDAAAEMTCSDIVAIS